MRPATLFVVALLASCRGQAQNASESQSFGDVSPGASMDSLLSTPRVVSERTVIVFWLAAADTFPPDDQAEALDELTFSTEQIAPRLAGANIKLVPTNSDSIYVALPNRERRLILLAGVDYPFGYVLLEPGIAERILAGLYNDDELLDEIEAYFNLPPASADSVRSGPRIST